MRSFILVLSTTAVLFGLFFLYTRLAAPSPGDMSGSADVAQDSTNNTGGLTQAQDSPTAAGAWVNLYDKQGQVYGRLRSRLCTPESSSESSSQSFLYHVADPQAEFYQSDGRIVRLTAVTGEVLMADQNRRVTMNGGGPMSPPSEGTLRDVLVSLYPGPAARDADQPDMTIRMANVQFDADTYRLFTIAQTDAVTGKVTPADQIAVTVRGRDIDFDGRGLRLDWDAEAHALRSLLIQHGQRLLLKSAAPGSQKGEAGGEHTGGAGQPNEKRTPPRLYRATFLDNVRVVQEGQDRITATQMDVTLAARNESGAVSGAGGAPASSTPTVVAGSATPGAAAAQSKSGAELFWSGPLKIVPVENGEDLHIPQGQAVAAFIGSPVHLHQNDLDIVAARVEYATATGAASVDGGAAGPMRMSFTRNGKAAGMVFAPSAVYSHNQLVVAGPGNGRFTDPDQAGDRIAAAWGKECLLNTTGTGDDLAIRRADLRGDASIVDGPAGEKGGADKLRINGEQIVTDFVAAPRIKKDKQARDKPDRPGTELQDLVATGHASCLIHDEKEPDRQIATDQLTVVMAKDAAGKQYPRVIRAEGNAVARQDQSEIRSQRMDATIAPQGKNNFTLQTFLASGDVHAKSKNGDWINGQALRVEEHDGVRVVTLLGSPDAEVGGAAGTLRGPEIQAKPDQQWARINGRGSIDCVRATQPGNAGTPMHVEWDNSAEIIGAENRVEVVGNVEANTEEPDGGAISSAAANRATLLLAPAKAGGAKAGAAKASASIGGAGFDLFKDKQVKLVSLLGHAQLSSTLKNSAGAILRRSYIESDRLDIDTLNESLTAPGAGRMLLEEHGKVRHAAAESADEKSSDQGSTAIQWNSKFNFDQSAGAAKFDGAVRVVHWTDAGGAGGSASGATEILADQVVADFEHAAAGAPADKQPRLTDVQALGNVQITTFADKTLAKRQKVILASKVTYDPQTDVLTASGTPSNRVIVSDAQSGRQESFGRVEINLRTNQFTVQDMSGQSR